MRRRDRRYGVPMAKRSKGRPKAGLPAKPAPASVPSPSEPGRVAKFLRSFGVPLLALAAAIGVGILLGVRSANQPPPVVASTPDATPTETAPKSTAPAAPVAAKTLFADNCGTCHTLADAGSTAGIGPNLDQAKPTAARVASMIANGSTSGIMQPGILTGDDATRVAAYVARVAGRG